MISDDNWDLSLAFVACLYNSAIRGLGQSTHNSFPYNKNNIFFVKKDIMFFFSSNIGFQESYRMTQIQNLCPGIYDEFITNCCNEY